MRFKRRKLAGTKRKRIYAREQNTVTIPRQVRGGMPSRLRTRLVYGDRISLSSTLPEHVFAGNALYDPDITGVGHQPRGFDQIMALYDHYQVTSSKITVHFYSTISTSGSEQVCFILPTDGAGAATTQSDVLEHDGAKLSLVGLENTGALRTKITHECTTKEQISTLDYSIIRGNDSSNPSELWYWHIGSIGNGSTTLTLVAFVRIEYQCMFTEPKTPGES